MQRWASTYKMQNVFPIIGVLYPEGAISFFRPRNGPHVPASGIPSAWPDQRKGDRRERSARERDDGERGEREKRKRRCRKRDEAIEYKRERDR